MEIFVQNEEVPTKSEQQIKEWNLGCVKLMKESDKHVQSTTLLVSVIVSSMPNPDPDIPLIRPKKAKKLPVYFVQRDYVIGL
jgi:hypothetical protein